MGYSADNAHSFNMAFAWWRSREAPLGNRIDVLLNNSSPPIFTLPDYRGKNLPTAPTLRQKPSKLGR